MYFRCASKCQYTDDYRVSKNGETYCYLNACPSEYKFVGGNDGYECKKTCDTKIYKVQNGNNLCTASCS